MKRKLETGEAIDLSPFPRTPEGFVIMPMPQVPNEDKDFCDYCLADTEEWIWWIVAMRDEKILAGTNPRKMPTAPSIKRLLWMR